MHCFGLASDGAKPFFFEFLDGSAVTRSLIHFLNRVVICREAVSPLSSFISSCFSGIDFAGQKTESFILTIEGKRYITNTVERERRQKADERCRIND